MKLKKGIKRVVGLAAIIGGLTAYSFSGLATTASPTVEINGVSVYSTLSYSTKEKTMIDINAFFNVMKSDYHYDKAKLTISYEGETASVEKHNGGLLANINDLANIIDAAKLKVREDGSFYILVLPKGTVKLSESYKGMGEHWANPAEDIFMYKETEGRDDQAKNPVPESQTIYGVYDDELVFLKQIIAQTHLEGTEVKSWRNLPGMKGLPSPAIVQSDIEFYPEGHLNYDVPHYDFHHYFISNKKQHSIKGQDLHHP